jgi:hypothetical protein
MMLEFYNELQSGKGPGVPAAKHLHRQTIEEIESTLHKVERPTRGLFPAGAGVDYRERIDRDAHLRDRFLLRPQRLRRLSSTTLRAPPCPALCRRRHGERAAQLHARAPSPTARSPGIDAMEFADNHDLREFDAPMSPGARPRDGADEARGRHSAEPGRVQDPPSRQ